MFSGLLFMAPLIHRLTVFTLILRWVRGENNANRSQLVRPPVSSLTSKQYADINQFYLRYGFLLFVQTQISASETIRPHCISLDLSLVSDNGPKMKRPKVERNFFPRAPLDVPVARWQTCLLDWDELELTWARWIENSVEFRPVSWAALKLDEIQSNFQSTNHFCWLTQIPHIDPLLLKLTSEFDISQTRQMHGA
jgi:hypothetical protein